MPQINPDNPRSHAAFRRAMGLFATGVCVVAFARTREEEGGEASDERDPPLSGMTINSLVSVSLEPMLVCWSLQNSASQYDEYLAADAFTISILAEGQQALARRYAARGDTTLNLSDFTWTPAGLPAVKHALAVLECRRHAAFPAGDHTLILGEVTGIDDSGAHEAGRRALAFFDGHFMGIGQ